MGHYEDVTCPKCGGARFIDDYYDYDLGKWIQYCCPECSGLGVVSRWTEEDSWWR